MVATLISITGYGALPATASPIWIASYGKAVAGATEVKVVGYNGRPTGATLVRIASYGKAPPAGATPVWISNGLAPAAATSAWSASDATTTGLTLSNGGMRATSPSAPVTDRVIRITTSHSSGKQYVEFFFNSIYTPSPGSELFGLANAGFVVGGGNYLGQMNYSCAISQNTNTVSAGFTSNYTIPGTARSQLNDVWALAVDFGVGALWIAQNNVWFNNSNPATGSLPIISFVPATVGPLFAAIDFYFPTSITIQPGQTSQRYVAPAGFTPWDSTAPPPSSSTWSAADATATGMTLSNGGLNVTGSGAALWKSIRGSISQTSGKLYVEFNVVVEPGLPYHVGIGLASAGFDPTAGAVGGTNYSGGFELYFANSLTSTGFTSHYNISGGGSFPPSEVWALAVDFSTGNFWVAQNNVWLGSSNPATGTLPVMSFVPATVGALFPAMSFNASSGTWTLQPTAASQRYAPPAGFTPWG